MKKITREEIRTAAFFKFDRHNVFENAKLIMCRVYDDICEEMEMAYCEDDIDVMSLIFQEIDECITYTIDQWEIMMEYQTPQEADYEQAILDFADDLYVLLSNLMSE